MFINMSDKQKIINDIYFDKSGFASRATTLKDARQKDKSITMDDVNQFFRKNVEEKRRPRGQNSFIAPHAYYEFQFDLFFINDLEKQPMRAGALCIDIFTKYMTVVPIPSKSEGDVASALIECFNKMGKFPKILYTDDESALNTKSIQDYLKEKGIQHHTTRGHPNFSERAIRSFKDALYKRIEADDKKGKQNIDWRDYIFQILLTYNNKSIHSSIKMTPNEARKNKNEYEVKINLELKGKSTRKYPSLDVGDDVKVMRKKAITEKERSSHWLKETFTVKRIEKKLGQNYYYVEGRDKALLRHELLKV